jgi:hypothetical protein
MRTFASLVDLPPVNCFLTPFQHKVLYDPNVWTNFCNGTEDLTFVILIQIPYYSYSCSDKYHVRHTTKCIPQFCQLHFLCTPLVLLMLNLALKILVYTMCTNTVHHCSCCSMRNILQVYWRHESTYVCICYKLSTLLANDLLHVN